MTFWQIFGISVYYYNYNDALSTLVGYLSFFFCKSTANTHISKTILYTDNSAVTAAHPVIQLTEPRKSCCNCRMVIHHVAVKEGSFVCGARRRLIRAIWT